MEYSIDQGSNNGTNHHRAFAIGITLNIIFVAVEIIFGLRANSTALLADAGHNAGDVLSLVFAWTAGWLATVKPGGRYTFGLRRITILVSILNALLLFAAVTVIAWNAVSRLRSPEPVGGVQVMVVAAIGVVINTVTALLFIRDQKNDLNIKGAFLHMAADAAVSGGVVIAGMLIFVTGLTWIDPVMSLLIVVIILVGTWRLFIDSVNLALDAVPRHISISKVHDYLLSPAGVDNIHDLHVWAISTTQVGLTAHLVIPSGNSDSIINDLRQGLKERFGITHVTFQVENKEMVESCNNNCI